MPRSLLLILLVLAACSEEQSAEPGRGASKPPGRDGWWKEATTMPSGAERILAPREMRSLLVAGEAHGFNADRAWWSERTQWVHDRVLAMDPDDEQANAAKGFKTLQSMPGFGALWTRMLTARVTTKDIDGLIQDYDHKVQDEEPVFLNPEGFAVETARFRRAKEHLDRLEGDPEYEALQVAIARVRGSSLNDYPFVYHAAGPFLVFYTARDLQRIEGEDDAAEDQRIADRRAVYVARLKKLGEVYVALVADVAKLYPDLWKQYAPKPRDIHYQWIFGERSWYQDYLERIHKTNPESPYRSGFLDKATGWCYLYEPAEQKAKPDEDPLPTPEAIVRETACYLAAQQLLRRWGKDPKGVGNRLERSRAYWVQEGWPSYVASRHVKDPVVGRMLLEGKRFNMIFPPLTRVTERESRLELARYREPDHEFTDDEDDERIELRVQRAFTDLAWVLVRHLHGDTHRASFERYLRAQIEGRRKPSFEECFGLKNDAAWTKLTDAVYGGIKDD